MSGLNALRFAAQGRQGLLFVPFKLSVYVTHTAFMVFGTVPITALGNMGLKEHEHLSSDASPLLHEKCGHVARMG
jgi:hypothetical protein